MNIPRPSLLRFLLLMAILLLPTTLAAPVKIACVGDSITYGYTIPKRGENSYPAQLQRKLDAAAPGTWEVKNFGVSAMTLMKNTSRSYRARAEYRASVDYGADIVIIMLGTNDSNGMFRHLIDTDFTPDYHSLIATYRQGRAAGAPRIILMLPPKCYLTGEVVYDPSEPVIQSAVVPRIREIAQKEGLELIDLYDALGTEWNAALMPDKLHPSASGAALMVERILPALQGSPAPAQP